MNEVVEWAPRIAVLEEQVKQLTSALAKHAEDSLARDKTIGDKLDGLLELKSKGLGAFWLASTLIGTGIIGAFGLFVDWVKG